jgi:hypothetical protein
MYICTKRNHPSKVFTICLNSLCLYLNYISIFDDTLCYDNGDDMMFILVKYSSIENVSALGLNLIYPQNWIKVFELIKKV